jgi:hypothetical protein
MNKLSLYIILVLSVLVIVYGVIKIVESNNMPVSAGLGAYATWAGGIMVVILGIIIFLVTLLILLRNKNLK